MMTVATTASAGNCDKFFLNLFCAKTWDKVADVTTKSNKVAKKGFYDFMESLHYDNQTRFKSKGNT